MSLRDFFETPPRYLGPIALTSVLFALLYVSTLVFAATLNVSANPTQVTPQESSIISWSATGATAGSCTMTPSDIEFPSGSSEDLTDWSRSVSVLQDPPNPFSNWSGLSMPSVAVIGDSVYVFGGYNGSSARDEIFEAPVSDPTAMNETSAHLPNPTSHSALAVIGDYIYLFGGIRPNASQYNDIYRAPVSDPLNWEDTGANLPDGLADAQVAVIGDYVYLFGGYISGIGYTNNIYRAPVSNPLSWTDTGSNLSSVLAFSALAVVDNYVYLFGGFNGSTYTNNIYRAPVSNPLSWSDTGANISASIAAGYVATIGNYVYYFGGSVSTGYSSDIYRAPVSNPLSWSTFSGDLYEEVAYMRGAVIGDNAYLFGGKTSSSVYSARVYWAPITPTLSFIGYGTQPWVTDGGVNTATTWPLVEDTTFTLNCSGSSDEATVTVTYPIPGVTIDAGSGDEVTVTVDPGDLVSIVATFENEDISGGGGGGGPTAWEEIYLTSNGDSDATCGTGCWTVPSDWDDSNNSIQVIGAGGSGGPLEDSDTGGGGGAYAKVSNLDLEPGENISFQVGVGGNVLPPFTQNGGDTWFDRFAGSSTHCSVGEMSVCAKGGNGGGGRVPALGGQASQSLGTVKYSGGTSGDTTGGHDGWESEGSGGGGGAGPYGPGEDGWDALHFSGPPYGGDGGNGYGGRGGGSYGPNFPTVVSPNGENGDEWTDGTNDYGSGGGGRGGWDNGSGWDAGLYGGGGGGRGDGNGTRGGKGASGMIRIRYLPITAPSEEESSMIGGLTAAAIYSDDTDTVVPTNSDVQTWTLSTSMQDYMVTTDLEGEVTLAYTNDAAGRDVRVDYIQIDGQTFEAESQRINTGNYNGACGAGSYSEWMQCNGHINFGTVSGGSHTIVVRAMGVSGQESITLRVGGTDDPASSKSYIFSTMTPGTYVFSARAASESYPTLTTYKTITVEVVQNDLCLNDTEFPGVQTVVPTHCTRDPIAGTCSADSGYEIQGGMCVEIPIPPGEIVGGTSDGLVAVPSRVRKGTTTQLQWTVYNMDSCGVTGSDGSTPAINNAANGSDGPAQHSASATVTQTTLYTLTCTGLDSETYRATELVTLLPSFQEI